MKLSEMKKSAAKHVLVFGPPKSGKTYLVGKLAEAGFNLKWFDLEGGRTTLYQLSPNAQERIEIFPIPDTRYFPVAAETMVSLMKNWKQKICILHGKCACSLCARDKAEFSEIDLGSLGSNDIFVWDSFTQFVESTMAHLCRNQKDEFYKPGWDEYNSQKLIHHSVLSVLQNAPFHCVVITHEGSVKMEDGREKIAPVGGTENFSKNTSKYFDEVVYVEVKNKKHLAASGTLYSNNILTGSRSGVETEKDAEASLLKIFKGGEEKVDQAQAMLLNMKREIQK